MIKTTLDITVEQEDLDNLGHVNNSKYVSYLELGRADWYAKAGISVEAMEKRGLGTVVVRLDILYLKEARLGQTLTITTEPVRIGNKSFVFLQNIYNEENGHVSEATVTSVMFDMTTRKSVTIAEEIAYHFQKV